jgi:hypothetical protein
VIAALLLALLAIAVSPGSGHGEPTPPGAVGLAAPALAPGPVEPDEAEAAAELVAVAPTLFVGQSLTVGGGLGCDLGKVVAGRARLSVEAGHDQYVHRATPTSSAQGAYGLVRLTLPGGSPARRAGPDAASRPVVRESSGRD